MAASRFPLGANACGIHLFCARIVVTQCKALAGYRGSLLFLFEFAFRLAKAGEFTPHRRKLNGVFYEHFLLFLACNSLKSVHPLRAVGGKPRVVATPESWRTRFCPCPLCCCWYQESKDANFLVASRSLVRKGYRLRIHSPGAHGEHPSCGGILCVFLVEATQNPFISETRVTAVPAPAEWPERTRSSTLAPVSRRRRLGSRPGPSACWPPCGGRIV